MFVGGWWLNEAKVLYVGPAEKVSVSLDLFNSNLGGLLRIRFVVERVVKLHSMSKPSYTYLKSSNLVRKYIHIFSLGKYTF